LSNDTIVALTNSRLKGEPLESLVDAVYAPGLLRETEPGAFAAHIWVDLAHVTMLAERELIPIEKAKPLLETLRLLSSEGVKILPIDPKFGSLLLQIERFIATRNGSDVAGVLQLARSRIDQSATVVRVGMRSAILTAIEQIWGFQEVLRRKATDWSDVIMPGYTHLQHSQPWVLGHYLLSHHDSLGRDVERLFDVYGRTNLSCLGTAAMSGTSWPVDRRRTAELLGCPDLVLNSQDAANFEMEFPAEVAAVLSILMSGLGRFASELYIWTSWEFGMIEIDDRLCGTSSIMPQKKNPYAVERVRALAGEAIGWLPMELGIARTPGTSDCDQFFATGHHTYYFDTVRQSLLLMVDTLDTMKINRERMLLRAGINWSTANDLADRIVRSTALDSRSAHHIAATLVRRSLEQGKLPTEVTAADVDAAAQEALGRTVGLTDDMVRDSLDPVRFVGTRISEGGVGPSEVKKLLDRAAAISTKVRARIDTERTRLASARRKLDNAMERIAAA
jgi:argininosuccinate lyase